MRAENREIRGIEMRATVDEESRKVEGYALLFNTDSVLMWGDTVERIAPGALDGVLERSDVLCLMNHDEQRGVLARYRMGEGSLSLTVDDKGLKYSFEAPKTALGDELIESLKRGDISQSSFAFSIEKDNWEETEPGKYVRTIVKFRRIYDVSPVYYPAYEDTSVALRHREGLIEKKNQEAKAKAEEKRKRELNEYYINLKKRF